MHTGQVEHSNEWSWHAVHDGKIKCGWGSRQKFTGQPGIEELQALTGETVSIVRKDGETDEGRLGPLISVTRYADGVLATFGIAGKTRIPAGAPFEVDKRTQTAASDFEPGQGRPADQPHGPVDAGETFVGVADNSTMSDTTRALNTLTADTQLHSARRSIVGPNVARTEKLQAKFLELTNQAGRHHQALADALESGAFGSAGEAATAADQADKMRRALQRAAAAQKKLDAPLQDVTRGEQLLKAAAQLVALLAKLVVGLFRASAGLARNDQADGIRDARAEAARIGKAAAAPSQGAEAAGAKSDRTRPARRNLRL